MSSGYSSFGCCFDQILEVFFYFHTNNHSKRGVHSLPLASAFGGSQRYVPVLLLHHVPRLVTKNTHDPLSAIILSPLSAVVYRCCYWNVDDDYAEEKTSYGGLLKPSKNEEILQISSVVSLFGNFRHFSRCCCWRTRREE